MRTRKEYRDLKEKLVNVRWTETAKVVAYHKLKETSGVQMKFQPIYICRAAHVHANLLGLCE